MFNKSGGKYPEADKNRTRVNEQIRISHVMLVDGEQNIGVVTSDYAKKMARERGLDLVEVSPNAKPPVCKIMDFGKFKYEKSIKEKEKNKKQKSSSEKQIRLGPSIAQADLTVKINSAKKFIESGYKVLFKLKYDKRENAHKDLGFTVINKIIEELKDVATTEFNPKLEGNCLNCVLIPKIK
jgi:translation initiation factor IF-3